MDARSSHVRSLAFVISIAIALPTAIAAHAAGSVAPLPATYAGVLPCADCAGIRHQLDLLPGGVCVVTLTYFKSGHDETFYSLGSWAYSADTTAIEVNAAQALNLRFAITAPGVLRKLDPAGKPFDSKLPYDLQRTAAFSPAEPRLTLRGNYFFKADAGMFTDCATGLRWPVAPGAGAPALEKAYFSARSSPGAASATLQPLIVTLEGRVLARPPAGLEGERATLLVERFLAAFPLESCGAKGVRDSLAGTRWVATSLRGTPVVLAQGQREAYVVFDTKASTISGFTGCNRLKGTFALGTMGEGSIIIGPAATTSMACPGGTTLERQLLAALRDARTYRLDGTFLELLDARGEVAGRFEAREPE